MIHRKQNVNEYPFEFESEAVIPNGDDPKMTSLYNEAELPQPDDFNAQELRVQVD